MNYYWNIYRKRELGSNIKKEGNKNLAEQWWNPWEEEREEVREREEP